MLKLPEELLGIARRSLLEAAKRLDGEHPKAHHHVLNALTDVDEALRQLKDD